MYPVGGRINLPASLLAHCSCVVLEPFSLLALSKALGGSVGCRTAVHVRFVVRCKVRNEAPTYNPISAPAVIVATSMTH